MRGPGDLTVLSIFWKTVTFDHNLSYIKHNFLAFFLKYVFAGLYTLNEKYSTNNLVSLRIVSLKTLNSTRMISNKMYNL